MTTKLLPRLVATGVLATALAGASAVAGLVSSAHATVPTPIVTRASNGGLDEHLTYDQVKAAAAEQSNARTLCQNAVVPAADAISAGTLHWTTCTTYTHIFAADLLSRQSAITINYLNGRVQARLG